MRNRRVEDADAGPHRGVAIRRGSPGQPRAWREPHPQAVIPLNLVAYAVGDSQPRRRPPVVLREPGALEDRECDRRFAGDNRELRRAVAGRAGTHQAVQVETGDHARLAADARDRIAEPIANHVTAEDEGAVEVGAIDLRQADDIGLRSDANRVGRAGNCGHVRHPRPVRRVFPEQRVLIAAFIERLEHEDGRRRGHRPIEQVIAGHARAQLVQDRGQRRGHPEARGPFL